MPTTTSATTPATPSATTSATPSATTRVATTPATPSVTIGFTTDRPGTSAQPAGPPKLDRDGLRRAQQETLDTPRMNYSLLSRLMFKPVDLMYGKQGSFTKFAMLEIIARVPYQAWERMGYWAVHRHAGRSTLARRVFERIVEARADQDNEQWHLLIMQDLVQRNGQRQTWLLHRLAPWLIAFFYYHVSWMLFLVRPDWSYRLNAEFEDHAEHEYMTFVAENPDLDFVPDPGTYADEYGRHRSLADLLRQIGHDERTHKLDSLQAKRTPHIR
jgi:ubiquinol oxidase